ncbi:glutathione S-transferase [Diplonema papillatum]|nr:glutathione S-transferase [Diplonema papillatum]
MAVPALKEGWRLYYWPAIGGRGLYVRVMFALAGVSYDDRLQSLCPKSGEDMTAWWKNVRKGVDAVRAAELGGQFPHFAMPIVTHTASGLCMNQTPAIMIHLAELFDLRPVDPSDNARALQILMQCVDLLAEAEQAYHPTSRNASYASQKEAAAKTVAEFVDQRLDKHLSALEADLAWCGARRPGEWTFFEKPTFADAACATLMRGYETSMAEHYESHAKRHYPKLCAHRATFEQHPPVRAFYDSWTGLVDDNSFMG